MRDTLPKKPKIRECGIVNLDISSGPGSHWIAYWKNANKSQYFDSFGNLPPLIELVNYLGKNITYNYKTYQNYNTYNCGHLCIKFLYNKLKI